MKQLFSLLSPIQRKRLYALQFITVLIGYAEITGSALLTPLTVFYVSLLQLDSEVIFALFVIFSIGFFFKSFEMIQYRPEFHDQAKYSSMVTAAKLPSYNHAFNQSLTH